VALLLIVSGWLVPLGFPHTGEDDRACARSFDGSDTPSKLDGAVADLPSDHCLWLEPGFSVDDRQFQSPGRPAVDQIPARAPPVHLHTI
jgi:hypothetical protein